MTTMTTMMTRRRIDLDQVRQLASAANELAIEFCADLGAGSVCSSCGNPIFPLLAMAQYNLTGTTYLRFAEHRVDLAGWSKKAVLDECVDCIVKYMEEEGLFDDN